MIVAIPQLVKISQSERPRLHDPVTDHGESAEEEGADDPTNGWIPDLMGPYIGLMTIWQQQNNTPTNIPRRAPTRAKSTTFHAIGAGSLSMPSNNPAIAVF